MAREEGKRRTESKYVWRRLAAFALFLLLVAGIVLSLTVFFKLRVVQVKGAMEIYTREEITAASGLKAGMNMFRFSTQAVERRILRTLPYASQVKVTRKLPDKVLIEVTEADNALVLPYEGGVLVLSQDLTVIGREESFRGGKCLTILGIEPVSAEQGTELADERPERIENLKKLIAALASRGLLSRATRVEVGDKLDLLVLMEDRVYAKLGTSAEMDRKMLMLEEMLDNQIGEEEYGILNLEVAGKAVFAPMKPEQFGIEVLGEEPPAPPEETPGEEVPEEETGPEEGGEEAHEEVESP